MKRLLSLSLVAALLLALAACGQAEPPASQAAEPEMSAQTSPSPTAPVEQANTGILIAYDGETLAPAAETLAETLGGELYDLSQDGPLNPAAYEFVLLGFRAENDALPDSVAAFLDVYDFGARTIYPFVLGENNTRDGVFAAISALEPGALLGGSALLFTGDTREWDIAGWARSLALTGDDFTPAPGDSATVATAAVTPGARQVLYLWEEGNVPAQTEYTENTGNYFDDPDFRPYLTSFPVPEGVEVKGAVLICAGGAFQFRSDQNEGTPVAEALSQLGYQSFVVDYRLRPYTQQEGALDLARAVRFVRAHAEDYGIDPRDIAVMGFSAGGILSGEMLLHFDGDTLPTVLDPDYRPDGLDEISADAAACGMIYSFYGRLSVGTTDVKLLRSGNLPPTFYCYGTRDPFYRQFLANADAVEEAGVPVERLQLEDYPHGFGAGGDWIATYDAWLGGVFAEN